MPGTVDLCTLPDFIQEAAFREEWKGLRDMSQVSYSILLATVLNLSQPNISIRDSHVRSGTCRLMVWEVFTSRLHSL